MPEVQIRGHRFPRLEARNKTLRRFLSPPPLWAPHPSPFPC